MKLKQVFQWFSIVSLILVASLSEAKNLRATQLDSKAWSRFFTGESEDWTVEFRQGDELPMSFRAEGDFFETRQVQPTPVFIKKNFWLKLEPQKGVFVSLDGIQFRPLSEVATGAISVGLNPTQPNGVANGIDINLSAFQK